MPVFVFVLNSNYGDMHVLFEFQSFHVPWTRGYPVSGTYGSFVPTRFVPELGRFAPSYDQFVPNCRLRLGLSNTRS